MPYVYLPDDHSEADLVLAGEVAEAIECEELFVTWTHESGPGGRPCVEAVVREAEPQGAGDLLSTLIQAAVELWRALTRPAARAPGHPQPASGEQQIPA